MIVVLIPENGENFVEYEVDGNKITFGDDELTVNLKKKERDDPVSLDVCRDWTGGLTLSAAGARTYVAQILIPAREYEEIEEDNPEYDPENPDPRIPEKIIRREAVPFDIDRITLRLYEEDIVTI